MARQTDQAAAAIRQLCSLGLPLQTIADDLGQALAALVPSERVCFFVPAPDSAATFTVIRPPSMLPDKLPEPDIRDPIEIMALERASFGHDTLEYFGAGHRFQNSRQYGDISGSPIDINILTPWGVRSWLRAALPGRGTGLVLLVRPDARSPYSAREERRLESVLMHVRHAIENGASGAQRNLIQIDEGFMVADLAGNLLHLCSRAKRMREAIVYPGGLGGPELHAWWESQITRLVSRLRRNLDGEEALPPVWIHQNAWGRFELRAQPLHPEHCRDTLAAVRVRRIIPAAVRIAAALSAFPLSPRQREVALRLAHGEQNANIAGALSLSPHTIGDLVKEVYQRLSIHSRQDLLQLLLDTKGHKISLDFE